MKPAGPDQTAADSPARSSCPAVLFLVFNRPEITARTFARIRDAAPARLYIHADGPRADRPEDASRCALVRQIVGQVDWPCETHHLFRPKNLGCGPAVAGALDWFFSEVEEGVVLEDDCLPRAGFFPWCAERLAAHRHDTAVFHISGMGFDLPGLPADHAGFYSPLPFIWGWATWRRAWRHYRHTIPPSPDLDPVLRRFFPDRPARDYWSEKLNLTREGGINTWDYQWVWTHWAENASAIIPARTLIENIGTGSDSTHPSAATDVGYAPPSDTTPAGPIFKPDPVATLRSIHARIFAPAVPHRTLAARLLAIPPVAYLHLGLRRRVRDWLGLAQRR